MESSKPYYSPAEVAEKIGVNRLTVYRWMWRYRDTGGREGLRYHNLGHRTKRIHRDDFAAFFENGDPVQ